MTIVIAILVLSILVVAHEFGHYLAGKRAGITVTDFAVGFGPKLVKWNKGGTEFSIRLLPLGGFCKFLGEDEDVDEKGAFNNASLWGRVKTVFSGPLFNIILALVLAAIMMLAYGNSISQVAEITPDSSAEQEGMMAGDIITSVNGEEVVFAGQASEKLNKAGNSDINITVDRGGEQHSFTLEKTLFEGNKMYVGVTMQTVRQKLGFFDSIWMGIRWTFYILGELVAGLFMMIKSLFTQTAIEGGVLGPVGTVELIGEAARAGFESLLALSTMLSINLGVINLLPLPALDGGRLIFFALEGLRGKPVSPDKEGIVHLIGFAALMLLMVFLTYNDISRMLGGG